MTGPAAAVLADNCSGLGDCSAGVQIAVAVLAVLLAVLAVWMIAEIVAAAAAAEAIEVAAAAEAAAAEAAAAEAAAAEAAAAEAAAAEAAAAEGEAAAAEAEAAEVERITELAKDPAHGGKITPGSIQEARAARGLERAGRLDGPVIREPSGAADFIDGAGKPWDVKSFNTNFRNGYDLDTAMAKIAAEVDGGEGVILNTTNMNPAAVAELRAAVEAVGDWVGRVVFWP